MSQNLMIHWADLTAHKLIAQKGDREEYVLASGITPSGTVHFGNFREVITVDFVARALRARGKKVRFLFSWDDYDTFRKIPVNMPNQELLQKYLFQPIVDTPDPYEREESYARHHEVNFENQLKKMGITADFKYQASKYRAQEYKEWIRKTLIHTQDIKDILNAHRTEPLADSWLPLSIYCKECNRDKISKMTFDGKEKLTYECELCGHHGEENIESSTRLKLPWRMDWPMRWAFEKVDFEPGGKDHSSQGGSYTTAKEIVKKVYDWDAPVYLQYDFVSIKGSGGKMSSSKGDLVTVDDVLKVYEPEMIRWIFASYKSNVDFSISFDLDAIKTYEDFDRQERLAYGLEEGNDKKIEMAKRVYELSMIDEMPSQCPFQPSFRHLCNVLQIFEGNLEKTFKAYSAEIKNPRDERRLKERSDRALFWLENYAPDEFKFKLNTNLDSIKIDSSIVPFFHKLKEVFTVEWQSFTSDKILHEKLYELIHEFKLEPSDVFRNFYQLLIAQDKGPKLASFILTIGSDKILSLLSLVR